MSIQRGQAEAFMLAATDGTRWILKKFHRGRSLDRHYLQAVCSVLPRADGFLAGTERRVLCRTDLVRTAGCYYSKALADWLDGSVLMPWVIGMDWAGIADEIREGRLSLQKSQRLTLCRNLTELIRLLEDSGCSHRDLAAGNLLIDPSSLAIFLIDFDSLYHPSLQMPPGTTCGTAGYAAPFTWRNGNLDPLASWCPHADRFALAILCTEFLIVDRGAPLTEEGGIFEQDDLRHRSGTSISLALDKLKAGLPEAAPLFEAAVRGNNHDDCPSPDAWMGLWMAQGVAGRPPKLKDLEFIDSAWFQKHLAKRRPPAPLWPAPHLPDMPQVILNSPQVPSVLVTIPGNPWTT